MRVVGRKAFGDVTLVQDGGGEQLHLVVPEPPTKPSPWGWELPEPLPHTRMREKELLPLLPFHGHFQLSLPWPVPELVGGSHWSPDRASPGQSSPGADTAKAELSLRHLLAPAASVALQVVAGTGFTATPFQSSPSPLGVAWEGLGHLCSRGTSSLQTASGHLKAIQCPSPCSIAKNSPKGSPRVSSPRFRPQKFISLSCLGQLALPSHG